MLCAVACFFLLMHLRMCDVHDMPLMLGVVYAM
jgi:hypothetical protein